MDETTPVPNPYRGQQMSWSDYEHEHEKRGSDWYWALGIIAISASLTSIIFGNFLFALVILIAAITLGLLANRPPKIVEFIITDKGFAIDDDLYLYNSIIAFCINESGDHPVLLVDTQKTFSPHLVISLEHADAEEVRDMLSHFIPEKELQEPLSHRVMEMLGF